MAVLIPSATKLNSNSYCFDDGLAGPDFRLTEDGVSVDPENGQYRTAVTKSVDALGVVSWTWRQMDGVPDGTRVKQWARFAISTACSAKTLRVDINGLVETGGGTTDEGHDELYLQNVTTQALETWPSVLHKNNNCGDEITETHLAVIESVNWAGAGCEVAGAADLGDEVSATKNIDISQVTCPTIYEMITDTCDSQNNAGGKIFYEITLSLI